MVLYYKNIYFVIISTLFHILLSLLLYNFYVLYILFPLLIGCCVYYINIKNPIYGLFYCLVIFLMHELFNFIKLLISCYFNQISLLIIHDFLYNSGIIILLQLSISSFGFISTKQTQFYLLKNKVSG